LQLVLVSSYNYAVNLGGNKILNTMPELLEKVREVILLCLDVENEMPTISKFIGVQQMEIAYEQA